MPASIPRLCGLLLLLSSSVRCLPADDAAAHLRAATAARARGDAVGAVRALRDAASLRAGAASGAAFAQLAAIYEVGLRTGAPLPAALGTSSLDLARSVAWQGEIGAAPLRGPEGHADTSSSDASIRDGGGSGSSGSVIASSVRGRDGGGGDDETTLTGIDVGQPESRDFFASTRAAFGWLVARVRALVNFSGKSFFAVAKPPSDAEKAAAATALAESLVLARSAVGGDADGTAFSVDGGHTAGTRASRGQSAQTPWLITPDLAVARALWSEAAFLGDADGHATLALFYTHGLIGHPRALALAALHTSFAARAPLGDMGRGDWSGDSDVASSQSASRVFVPWYLEAKEGALAARLNEGFAYSRGWGKAASCERALEIMISVANVGAHASASAHSLRELAKTGLSGDDRRVTDETLEAAAVEALAGETASASKDVSNYLLNEASRPTLTTHAHTSLGFMFLLGRSANLDPTRAAYHFAQAAEQGDAVAFGMLGFLYYTGVGVDGGVGVGEVESERAREGAPTTALIAAQFLREAAATSFPGALNLLGAQLLRDGKKPILDSGAIPVIRDHAFAGADQNGKSAASVLLDENIVARAGVQGTDVLALLLFSRAAELGSAEASHNLALMALAGRGGGTTASPAGSRNSNRDFKQALVLFQKAAAAGYAPSAVRAAIMLKGGIGVPLTSATDSTKHCKTALALVTGALSRAPPPSLAAADRAWERLRTMGDPHAAFLDFARAAYAGSEVGEWNAGFFASNVVSADSLLFAEPTVVDEALRSALARDDLAAKAVASGSGDDARFLSSLWSSDVDSMPLLTRPKSKDPEWTDSRETLDTFKHSGDVNIGLTERQTPRGMGDVIVSIGTYQPGSHPGNDKVSLVGVGISHESVVSKTRPEGEQRGITTRTGSLGDDGVDSSSTATPSPTASVVASPATPNTQPLLFLAGNVACTIESSARTSGAALRALFQGVGGVDATSACPLVSFTASFFSSQAPSTGSASTPHATETSIAATRELATSFFSRSAALGNGHASVRATDLSSPTAAVTLRAACAAHVPTACFALGRSLERTDAHLAKRFYDLAVEETRVTSGNAAAAVRAVQRPVSAAIWRLRARRTLIWLHGAVLMPVLDVTALLARAAAPSHTSRIDATLARASEFLTDALALPPAGSSDAVKAGLKSVPVPDLTSTAPQPTLAPPRDGAAALESVRESIRKTERARAAERAKISFTSRLFQSVEGAARTVREGVRGGLRHVLQVAESFAHWESTLFLWVALVLCVIVLVTIVKCAF